MALPSFFSSTHRSKVKTVQFLYVDPEGGRYFHWFHGKEGGSWRGFSSYEDLIEAAARTQAEVTFLALSRALFRCAKLSLPPDAKDSLAEAIFYRVEKSLLVSRDEIYYSFFVAHDTPQGIEGLLVGVEKAQLEDLLVPLREKGVPLAGVYLASFGFSYLLREREFHHVLTLPSGRGREVLLTVAGRVQDSVYLPDDTLESLTHVVETKIAECPGPRFFIAGLSGEGGLPDGKGDVLDPVSLDPAPLVKALLSAKEKTEWALGFNLLPQEERKVQRMARKDFVGILARYALAMALLALIVSPLVHYGLANRKAKTILASLRPLAKRTKKLDKMDQYYQKFLSGVIPYLPVKAKVDVLRELVDLMPKGTILNIVSITPKALKIEGYTPSASQALQALERSPFFHNATFVVPVTKGRGRFKGLERFGIKAEIG